MTVRVGAFRTAAVAVALAMWTASCARERPAETPAGQSFVVDSQPILSLEGTAADGTVLFGAVAGATRLPDGTLVIADRSGNALKLFDAEGRLTRTIGRPGQGPGEFSQVAAVRQCLGDSLFAWDYGVQELEVFSSSGSFARQVRLTEAPVLVACSRHGVLAFIKTPDQPQPPQGAEVFRLSADLLLADARGAGTHGLGSVSLAELTRSFLPRPGGLIARFAVGRERLYVCPTDSGTLGVYDIASGTPRSIPLAVNPRAPTRRQIEHAVEDQLIYVPAGALRDRFRERFLRVPPPESLQPCSNVLVDPDDNVWVVLSFPGDTATTLRVFGPDDRMLGDVTVPEELNVLEIGSDYLLASGESPAGEPWVRVYAVRRTRS